MSNQRSFWLNSLILVSCVIGASDATAQRQWMQVTAYDGMKSIQFSTADTGYAILNNDSLIRTTDGGQSWNGVSLPFINPIINPGNELTFYGSNGWLVIHERSSGQPARLLRTADNGFTWTLIPFDSSFKPTEIFFKSPSLGYLWWGTYFYVTTDSGKSWQSRNNPPSQTSGIRIFSVGQPNVVLGMGNGSNPNGQAFNDPYLSTDTGANWNAYTGPLMAFDEQSGPPMAYIGMNTWITNNAWSADNGQTWDTVPTSARYMTSPIITDTLGHGMFTGFDVTDDDSLLYFTNNFGQLWDSVKAPFAKIQSGLIVGDVWYVLANDSSGNSLSLYRSLTAPANVSNTNEPSEFQILTNPATHFLQISLEDTPDDIRIVDFLGRTVARYSTLGGEFSADVSGLPEGLYWVVARSGAHPFIHLN